jgi:hypothetical protein
MGGINPFEISQLMSLKPGDGRRDAGADGRRGDGR